MDWTCHPLGLSVARSPAPHKRNYGRQGRGAGRGERRASAELGAMREAGREGGDGSRGDAVEARAWVRLARLRPASRATTARPDSVPSLAKPSPGTEPGDRRLDQLTTS